MVKTKIGGYRWRILALLFMATTINYMDRSIIGVLAPTLQEHVFHWNNVHYGYITISFMVAYAIGMLIMGGLIDKFGTKIGYTLSIGIWSFFSLAHAFVTRGMGWIGFAVARFGLGIGEAGNFPACIKTVAEWFPKKERAFATGIFNAGTNVGATLMPLILPLFVLNDGTNWRYSFVITFSLSLIWVILWLRTYKKPEHHSKVSKTELNYILSDNVQETTERIPWLKVFPVKQTWAFAVSKFTDAVWWFYLFWGSVFLHDKFGLQLAGLALPLIIIYLMADAGSIFGGWLSSAFIKSGWSINRARKTTLFICGIIVLPVVFVTQTDNQWIAVFLIGLAAGGHQAWSANVFTLVSDVFPKKATASVVGIGGMTGAIASSAAFFILGHALDNSTERGFFFAFLVAGSMYLICLLIVHLIMPKMTPLNDDLKPIDSVGSAPQVV